MNWAGPSTATCASTIAGPPVMPTAITPLLSYLRLHQMSLWPPVARRWGHCRQPRNVPVVFVQVGDPVGAGFVESLARPGGNATGFSVFEYGISAKWLELLKDFAP